MNKTKISALERTNAELTTENSNLKTEIARLETEIDRLGKEGSDVLELEEVVPEDIDPEEISRLKTDIADQQQKRSKSCALAFFLGILATLVAWAVIAHLNGWPSYLSFLK